MKGEHVGKNSFFFFFLFPSSLLRNPVTNKKHYRLYVINKLPQIRVLDFQKVKLKVRYNAESLILGPSWKMKHQARCGGLDFKMESLEMGTMAN